MDESDAIRATTPAATCELRLSLWHAPSSADPSPLDFSSAASRETPARCDIIDMFLGWRSQALISARQRCGRKVTQEFCACVCGTSLILCHQHASRGTRDGASGPLLECGSTDLLRVHAIHASCQSVGLSSCVDVGHCIVSSCDKKVISRLHALAKLEQRHKVARHGRLSVQMHGPDTRRPHMRTHD